MKEFQLQGINHLALVCKDIARKLGYPGRDLQHLQKAVKP